MTRYLLDHKFLVIERARQLVEAVPQNEVLTEVLTEVVL